jgi:HAD superfamily hydrolase (TIGR01450 family)
LDNIPHITFAQLLEQFEVLLFDSDGVLVRWPTAIAHAPEAIAMLNALGKPYFVLTNDASQVAETRASRYAELGLAIEPDKIISSGMLLKNWFKEQGLQGARCVVLGTEDSVQYVQDAGGQVAPFDEDFEVLVVGDQDGFPFLDATGMVLTTLFLTLDRGDTPRLVVPNPDLYYPEKDGFGFASGTVAGMFESALALRYPDRADLTFARLGKPHPSMFEEVFRRTSSRSLVMIGDTPSTDIRGANNVGITSVLVETGGGTVELGRLPVGDVPDYRLRGLAL